MSGEYSSKDEIEITPEMIEAGIAVAWAAPLMEPDDDSIRKMVEEIFRSMSLVRRVRHS